MPKNYNFLCVVMGEYKLFVIEIESTELVGNLKNKIKEAKRALKAFANIAAYQLKLYKVEIPTSDDIKAAATRVMTESPGELGDGDELVEHFGGGPKRKMVHIIIQLPEPEVTPTRDDAAEEDNLKALFESSPSSLSRPRNFRSAAKGAVHCNRPFMYNPIPIDLFQPEFGEFKKDCRITPTAWAQELLQDLTEAACMWYDAETDRRSAILEVFDKAGLHLTGERINRTEYCTDGNFEVNIMPPALRDCKNEFGCALMEAIGYYVQFLKNPIRDHCNSRFPTILMVDVGPCIAFYGCLWTGKHLHVEPLTPTYDLTTHWTDEMARNAIASSLDAFRKAVGGIEKHYETLSSAPPVDRVFPYPTCYKDEAGNEVKFRYQSRIGDKLIFRASVHGDVELCVKFTRRYSAEAHRFLADLEHAPRLRGVTSLPGDWLMVVMDFLPHPLLSTIISPSVAGWQDLVKAKIGDIVQKLHERGFVHGDIRDVNILVDPESLTNKDDCSAYLLDFDWAGKNQEVRYPGRVNTVTVQRPNGVSDGELITKSHDMEMVSLLC